ncbi:MAG: hypothetical protein ACM3S3_03115 [Candidatus Doudnabacteria bacterium]
MPTLLAAVRRARLPVGVPTYVGSYGLSVAVAQEVATFPECRYAPMFALTNEWYRQRRLPPEQEPQVSKRLGGQVPPLAQLRSTSARVSWGVELGARYRDAIRAAGDAGANVDAWQLDEIVPSAAAAAAGIPIREFTRGVVRGLAIGRPILGDVAMRGFVWVAQSASGIARLAITPELRTF